MHKQKQSVQYKTLCFTLFINSRVIICISFTILRKEMMLIAHTAFLFVGIEGASGKRYFSPYIN
jgi:hypothetical protein